uniref:Uncharacterized protein n=1 Tax=Arundo donax TaxID=35708 RepID=A0A0A8XSJ1_ARUDO
MYLLPMYVTCEMYSYSLSRRNIVASDLSPVSVTPHSNK